MQPQPRRDLMQEMDECWTPYRDLVYWRRAFWLLAACDVALAAAFLWCWAR